MKISNLLIFFVFLFWCVASSAQLHQRFSSDLVVQNVDLDTGFPVEIWGKEPDVPAIIQQINEMASSDLNDEERYWFRQILLTDTKGNGIFNKNADTFLEARVNALLGQGLFDDALQLVHKSGLETDKTRQYLATILFAKGEVEEACSDDMMAAFGDDEPFVRVACAVALKTPDEVMLAYDVYQEENKIPHPFLTAAGEARYLKIYNPLPKGVPSFWELPMLVGERPEDVFKLPLSRGLLVEIEKHETLPIGIRDQATMLLNPSKTVSVGGIEMLKRLKNLAQARQAWEEVRP